MKRGKTKKVGKRKREGNKGVWKKRIKSAIIVLLILLFVLIIFYLIEIFKPLDEIVLEGELGTLKWDFAGANVTLDVLNYSIYNNSQTINVTINWSLGEQEALVRVLLVFNREWGNCNYTTTDLPNFGVNKIYEIDVGWSSCDSHNFTNFTGIGVDAFAQIDVPLRQISLIENVSIYNGDGWSNIINLSSYFSCLGEISFDLDGDSYWTGAWINNTIKSVNIDPRSNWYGVYKFNLTASCDEDVLDVSSEGENMTFYIIALNETRAQVVANRTPNFIDSACGYFSFYINTNYTIDMDYCFEDEDQDPLTFRYVNMSISNISIERKSGNRLVFIPEKDFLGRGYFYIYANDSLNETRSERIYIEVIERTANITNVTQNTTQNVSIPEITSSTSGINFQFYSKEGKTFSITAENYDIIEWYLNNRLVKVNSNTYMAANLSKGNYTLKVEVKKGGEVVSRSWNLTVLKEEIAKRGNLLIIAIFIVLSILILLVALLIIKNFMERKEEIKPKPVIQLKHRFSPKMGPGLRPRPRQRPGLRRRFPLRRPLRRSQNRQIFKAKI